MQSLTVKKSKSNAFNLIFLIRSEHQIQYHYRREVDSMGWLNPSAPSVSSPETGQLEYRFDVGRPNEDS